MYLHVEKWQVKASDTFSQDYRNLRGGCPDSLEAARDKALITSFAFFIMTLV